MKKVIFTLKAIAVCFFAILILIYSVDTAESVKKSISICINSIIPSMFAFMAVSSYILTTGAYRKIFRPIIFIFRRIVKCDDTTISVFLLSLFGGYPIGIKLISDIIAENKNYRETAINSAMFCYCISPPFAIIMLGMGIFGSTEAGIIIYISNMLAVTVLAAAVTRIYNVRSEIEIKTYGGSFVSSVISSSHSLVTVCSVLIAFNVIMTASECLLNSCGIETITFVKGFFEISNLLDLKSPSISMLPFVSGAASFGGVCVITQCMAIAGKSFSFKRFLTARILCSLLSGLITYIFTLFFDISCEASTSGKLIYNFSAEKTVLIVLIIMCVIILEKSDKIFKKV